MADQSRGCDSFVRQDRIGRCESRSRGTARLRCEGCVRTARRWNAHTSAGAESGEVCVCLSHWDSLVQCSVRLLQKSISEDSNCAEKWNSESRDQFVVKPSAPYEYAGDRGPRVSVLARNGNCRHFSG